MQKYLVVLKIHTIFAGVNITQGYQKFLTTY